MEALQQNRVFELVADGPDVVPDAFGQFFRGQISFAHLPPSYAFEWRMMLFSIVRDTR